MVAIPGKDPETNIVRHQAHDGDTESFEDENQMPEDWLNEDTEENWDWDDDEDEEDLPSGPVYPKWIKRTVIIVLALVLLGNVLAMWPQIYNLDAIRFLAKNRELSQNESIRQYKQAVVVVKTDDGKGTGFNIHESGLIVTNEHVVDGGGPVFVQFPGERTYSAEVVMRDVDIDLALLKLNEVADTLPIIEISSDLSWIAGEPVYVIGNPLFFTRIANEGRILGLTRLQGWNAPVMMLQAPIYKGNSGSPVLDVRGRAIAVVFATSTVRHEGQKHKVGLAVPIANLIRHLDP